MSNVNTQSNVDEWFEDKEPDTNIHDPIVHNVTLHSRYDKTNEFIVMMQYVNDQSPKDRSLIKSVSCNSKEGAAFDIKIKKKVDAETYKRLAHYLMVAANRFYGGHGTIAVSNLDEVLYFIPARWEESAL